MGNERQAMKLLFGVVCAALAFAAAWEEVAMVNDLPQDVKMAQMLVESKEFAALDGDSRSGEGTEIQRAIRGYVGTFLEHMDMLPMDAAQSMSKLNTLLQSYLSAPEDLPATLKKIRDKVPKDQLATFELLSGGLDTEKLTENVLDRLPHDGDKMLMGDHSSCGEQSVDDLFMELYEQNPRPELEYALESKAITTVADKNSEEWPLAPNDADW